MIEWEDTGMINNYTGMPNKKAWYKGVQLLVYRRQYGFAFTCRIELTNSNWVQESSGSQGYRYFEEESKMDAIVAADDLLARLGSRVVVKPRPPKKAPIPDHVLKALGISREDYQH